MPPRPPAANHDAATAAAADSVLDTADGLRRLMGAGPLYHQLLRRFVGDYADAAARLRQSLDAGQTDAAGRLAHTLKGAAGLIGAGQVCALAAAIDSALRGGRHHGGSGSDSGGDDGCNSGGGNSGCSATPAAAAPPAAEAWDELNLLERALGRLFERIEQIEQIARLERLAAKTATAAANPTAEAAAAVATVAAIPAAQLCAQLAQLLRDGDGAAIDLLEGAAAQLAAHLGETAWRRLDAAAQRFDFEAALAVLAAGDGAGDGGAPLSG